eukprot:maker-scaffold132_size323655-snap-gene-2.24 protein:Tk07910 transcript:maker-scaffold132_size323655-snap-gene-2.24-mRNA-1 annotation:"carboxylesterase"
MQRIWVRIALLACFVYEVICVQINTSQGEIKGATRKARNGDPFAAFLGIPFAQPPIGLLRWRRPQPMGSWTGIRNGLEPGKECLQDYMSDPSIFEGSEDCLYLNVFTKHPGDPEAKRNVMVWIHGGAFIFGGGKLYNPEYIMEEDIVLVVVQYRLNIFGFLSTEDSFGPGNYGMWDQVEALKWVQRNIEEFGGDPDKVTIVGMSAGGASVHYHMLSKQSHYLFQNAIGLSGTALNWWAHIDNPKKNALKLAHHTNCLQDDSEAMLDCMRKIPGENVANLQKIFFDYKPDLSEIMMKIKRFYHLENMSDLDDEKIHRFIDVLSDSMFNYGIDKTVKLHAQNSEAPTYFYHLTFPSDHTLANLGSHPYKRPIWEPLKLASHGTDMLLLFNMFPIFEPMTETEVQVSRDFVKLLVDFAKAGRSTLHPDWRPLNLDAPNYLEIDATTRVVEAELPNQHRLSLWDDLKLFWHTAASKDEPSDLAEGVPRAVRFILAVEGTPRPHRHALS